MASRGWVRSIITATLVAAGCGAAQLGLGYGLGIIAWFNTDEAGRLVTDPNAWTASLAWTAWIAATSVVGGAICADRLGPTVESGRWSRLAWRTVIALAASLGALITVPLVAVPARAAQLANNFAPDLLAGVYAVAGVVIGLAVALGAITARAIAANVIASAAWLWALAVIAVVDGVAAGRGLGFAHLAVWQFTGTGPTWRSFYVPGSLLMLGAALLIGGLAALPAARRGDNRVGVVISGAMGPLLVAGAYFLAGPSRNEIGAYSAFLTAPYAALIGLAGSLLIGAMIGGELRGPGQAADPEVPEPLDALALPPAVGTSAVVTPAAGSSAEAPSWPDSEFTEPKPRPATGKAKVVAVAEPAYGDAPRPETNPPIAAGTDKPSPTGRKPRR
jgi:hypothetical protein